MEFLNQIFKNAFNTVVHAVINSFACYASGFDPIGGDYDEQTGFSFDKMLFMRARTRTIIGKLSGSAGVYDMYAGSGPSLDGSAAILRKEINSGDMVRFTMQEHMKGAPSYGDQPVTRGNFLEYKNAEARVNKVTSPSVLIQGEEDQKRVLDSITNIPGAAKEEVVAYHGEEMERQAIIAWLYGASPSVLLPQSEGGLGHNLGVGSGAGAGEPLMCKNFYTPDTGFLTYSSTAATFNSTVNDAINGIDADVGDMLSLIALKVDRAQLDKDKFWPLTIGGKKYVALKLMDSELFYRLDHLLGDDYRAARERGRDNPIFNLNHTIEYLDQLFINVPNLDKFRMAYNATNGYPDIGPGLRTDHRDYVTTSKNALMLTIGARSLMEGYRGSIKVAEDTGRFKRGLEIMSEGSYGYVRGEFYAKDGSTGANACVNQTSRVSAFYEPGVGVNYS